MKLRIAHLSTQRGWHGGEQQLRLLVEGLGRLGHESLIIARSDGELVRRMAAAGHTLGVYAGRGRGLRGVWQIRRHLARWQPDVVHFHDGHALSGGGLAAWRLPIAARIASRKVAFPIGHAWRYRQFADRVICVSRAVSDICVAGGVPGEQLRVVYDGVDPQRAASGDRQRGRRALGAGDAQYVLLCVASLVATKGLEYLLTALPEILARHPQVRLCVAGEGELREALQRQSQGLGVEHAVAWLGYRQDVPDLIQAADLFVLPSLLEGMCSTLVDVMLARRPIVATAVGGVPEVLGATAHGGPVASLVAARDPAALGRAIQLAIEPSAALADQTARAYQRALDQFTAARMVEQTLQVYREVLAGHAVA